MTTVEEAYDRSKWIECVSIWRLETTTADSHSRRTLFLEPGQLYQIRDGSEIAPPSLYGKARKGDKGRQAVTSYGLHFGEVFRTYVPREGTQIIPYTGETVTLEGDILTTTGRGGGTPAIVSVYRRVGWGMAGKSISQGMPYLIFSEMFVDDVRTVEI